MGALLGMILFMLVPSAVNNLFYNYAPIEWWVDVKSINVSNIDAETMHQTIEIERTVSRELNGIPRQELYLVAGDDETELFQVPAPTVQVDYEPKPDNNTVLPFDFWENKGVDDQLRAIIKNDETYRWVWVIEFERPNGITEVKRYPSNTFVSTNYKY